jgi:hypothetical protein
MESIAELIAKLPQYQRNVSKRKPDSGVETKSYHCCCCNDTGVIHPHLVKRVMPDYQLSDLAACTRTSACRKSWIQKIDGIIDYIDPETCEILHQINFAQWQDFTEAQAQKHREMVNNFTSTI